MKKFAFVFTLVLVLALASVAYASTFSTYQAWDAAYNSGITGVAQADETPHMGYQSATEKCAVCHAVHKATFAGQLLLRGNAADACTYCHITTNIGGKVVYGGVVGNYSTATDDATSHTYNGSSVGTNTASVRCVDCHSVHGANTYTGGGNIGSKILRYYSAASGIARAPQTIPGQSQTVGTSKAAQETMFCSQCHPYYDPISAGTGTNVVNAYGSGQTGQYQSHPMTSPADPFAGVGATFNTGAVAWVDSLTCRRCHDGGLIDQAAGTLTNSFPHDSDAARFLLVANADTSATAAATISSADGACLKCHRTTGAGVGITY